MERAEQRGVSPWKCSSLMSKEFSMKSWCRNAHTMPRISSTTPAWKKIVKWGANVHLAFYRDNECKILCMYVFCTRVIISFISWPAPLAPFERRLMGGGGARCVSAIISLPLLNTLAPLSVCMRRVAIVRCLLFRCAHTSVIVLGIEKANLQQHLCNAYTIKKKRKKKQQKIN